MAIFVTSLAIGYGSGVLVFYILHFLVGERSSVIAFLNTIIEWLLLPVLPLLMVCLLTGSALGVIGCLPALSALILNYARQYLPRRQPIPAQQPVVRVLTYNLLANTRPLDRALAILNASGADVIALQEVSRDYDPRLKAGLSAQYPYHVSYPQPLQFDGQAVFSKFPLSGDSYWQYDWLPTPLGHLRVMVEADYGAFVVYNVHPTHPGMNDTTFDPSYRAREIADLLLRIGHETLPVLMMGDFNMPDHSDDYRTIRRQLQDSYRQVGWGMGWTFRAALPLAVLRLDYVFHSPHWQALEAEVVSDHGGSDHFPVKATLAYPN